MNDENCRDDGCPAMTDTCSRRVPREGNAFAGGFYEQGVIRLPITSDDRLYLPKMNMRTLVDVRGHQFPNRLTENIQGEGEVDFAITREGFLVQADHADVALLERLTRYILLTYGVLAAPYDVICRTTGETRKTVSMIRLVPCQIPERRQRTRASTKVMRYFSPDSDDDLLACMNIQRVVSVSEFTEESLDLAAELAEPAVAEQKQPARRSRPRQEVQKVHLCSMAEMERRIEREPNRNSGGGAGSLPTLGQLCEEKNLIVPSKADISRIVALNERLPNFSPVIDYVARKLEAQRLCASPMRLPPLLLLGDAGVGKSHFCRMLTEVLGMPFECVAVAGSSQELHITGLSKSWGSAGPSRFAEIMGNVAMANPLIMVDEIDKASDIKVQNALLQIFEPETAARWVDQYVEVPLDLSRVMFVATANDQESISPVLLSRFEIFRIEKPSAGQLVAVFNSIYLDERSRFGYPGMFDKCLPEEVGAQLVNLAMTPREARRVLLNAMELAVIRTHRQRGSLRRGRVTLQVADLPVKQRQEMTGRIGFV